MLQEGFDAYKMAGPFARCPYGADERNGIWVFGKQKAKQGFSIRQTCHAFRKMERVKKMGLLPLDSVAVASRIAHVQQEYAPPARTAVPRQ